MTRDDYPALYGAADTAANRAQENLLVSFRFNSFLLIGAAVVSLVSARAAALAVVGAALFLGSLATYVYAKFHNFRGRWYQARALAESVKTTTWRLVMAADPFTKDTEPGNLREFRDRLSELLRENQGIGEQLSGDWSSREQVTGKMNEILRWPFEKKRAYYLEHRIEDQLAWYARRAESNKANSTTFSRLLYAAYAIAVALSLIQIAVPRNPFLPIETFAVLAASIVGWMHLRRYDELSSAYGLTAHELGIIKTKFVEVQDPEGLADFVADAENAFSREHTQWAARRDH